MYKLSTRIAWASLKRRKGRSILVVLMITVSLWGLLFMEGIYDGMTEQMIGNAIRSSSGHISLFTKGYRQDPDIKKMIGTPEAINGFLQESRLVKTTVQRILQDGLIATAHYSRGATIFGIDLDQENKHGNIGDYLQEGAFSFGPKKKGVILGAKLAEKLKVKIGKKVILSAQNTENEVASIALKVSGIIKTNNMGLDETAVFIDRKKADDMLLMHGGTTQISIMLHTEKSINQMQTELAQRFPDLEVFRWDQMYPALMQSRVMMKGFNLVTSFLVFCVAGLGIFGVILVSVLERLREFGIMLAIGTKFKQISQIVMIESFFLGFIGFLGGSALGGTTLYYYYRHGLDLTIFSQGLDAFGIDSIIYAIIRPGYFLTALISVTLATLLSVLIPLRILKKSNPIETIHKI
ncbi:MAG: FtsX-like permease family protein [Desulfobulbaceae bacterium]|nr:FtsX-like permease family protein [Desulfobulbaceae bacterium]